jgi:hypothetical protein
MAMSADVLGPQIQAAIDALEDKTDRPAIYKAIAGAVIEHIQETATISGLVVAATSPPGGGPVTGTAAGTPGCIQ